MVIRRMSVYRFPEDRELLRFAGLLGHRWVGIYTLPGKGRHVRVQANTMAQCVASLDGDKEATIYMVHRASYWRLVYQGP